MLNISADFLETKQQRIDIIGIWRQYFFANIYTDVHQNVIFPCKIHIDVVVLTKECLKIFALKVYMHNVYMIVQKMIKLAFRGISVNVLINLQNF